MVWAETEDDTGDTSNGAAGNVYVGLKGIMIPWGESKTEVGASQTFGYRFSGGLSLVAEYAVLDFLAVGGEVGYLMIVPSVNTATMSDHQGFVLVDPSLRFFYSTQSIEAYLKMAGGFMMGVNAGSGPGWNVMALPGVMYKRKNFGVFLEVGFMAGSWNADSVDMLEKMVLLNFGFVGII